MRESPDPRNRPRPPIRAPVALVALAAVVFALLAPSRAFAVPAFANRTGMQCTSCHDSWGELNDFGELYRDNGYQLPGRTDSILRDPSLPISVRSALLYNYTSTTHQPTDSGSTTIGSGGIGDSSADLIMGGSFADNVSALILATGFASDGKVALESAWARISNIFGSNWLNLRAGLMELDLPASEHRALALNTPYAFYHYHPVGSANSFSMGDNQVGVELMGHTNGAGFRYSVAVLNGEGTMGTNSVWSAPTVYAHVTETWHPYAHGLTRVRIGAFGTVGWMPTGYSTLTPYAAPMGTMPAMPSGPPAAVPGTGFGMSPTMLAGGEVSFTFGPLATPFIVRVVGAYGQDDAALVAGATQNASYFGGFAQIMYTPVLRGTIFGTYNWVRSLQAGVATQDVTIGDVDGIDIGGRYWIFQSYVASVALHLEGSWVNTQGTSLGWGPASQDAGLNVTQTIFSAGFDVAL